MKTLVLVDFDKTLYKKDSLIEFTRFYKGTFQLIIGFIALSPMLLKWKLGKISNETAKQQFIAYFFKNEYYNLFLEKGKQFSNENISINLNKNIWEKIQNLQEQNADIYIVTASFREWIYGWTEENNLELITTKLEIVNNKITGKFKTKNCYGIEKVNRIKEKINLENYDKIVVFGNGKGDYEMLQLSK
ncbi:HAD family hydrolase [Flavobacterium sp.]|jgi:HAD superfamily phosphoserine phosphatase-like hydrolase|uniref:HAD family hydrolase n=1 Tax=Flavobacterium sp. TaxID=239 RepID=UPI0037C0A878